MRFSFCEIIFLFGTYNKPLHFTSVPRFSGTEIDRKSEVVRRSPEIKIINIVFKRLSRTTNRVEFWWTQSLKKSR